MATCLAGTYVLDLKTSYEFTYRSCANVQWPFAVKRKRYCVTDFASDG